MTGRAEEIIYDILNRALAELEEEAYVWDPTTDTGATLHLAAQAFSRYVLNGKIEGEITAISERNAEARTYANHRG